MKKHPPETVLCAFLDHELEAQECAPIEAHLESCEACTEFVTSIRGQRSLIRAIGDLDLPVSFARSTANAVRTRYEHEKEWDTIEKTAQRVLATLVVLAALLFAFSSTSPDASSEAQYISTGVFQEYFPDSSIARVATMSSLTHEDVLAAALSRP